MSRRFKRLLAVLLSVVMTLSSNLMVFAANTTSAEDAIIAQAIGLNENFDVDEHDFSVISLEEDNVSERSISDGKKAIQTIEIVDGVTVATTIFPFKVLDSGELVNSFVYAESDSSKTRAANFTTNFVDITVTSTAYYETVMGTSGSYYYRHKGVSAYWSTDDSVASVHELNVVYRTCGSLYYYLGDGYGLGNKEADNKEAVSTVEEIYPEINAVFSNYDNTTPPNKVFVLGSDTYGGWVTVNITFYAAGQIQTDRADYTVY